MKEISVVFSPSYRVGMLGSQDLLTNGQGTLLEGLGQLVLALISIEDGQLMQGGRCGGMLGSLHLLTDGQGLLIEGLGQLVLALPPVEQCQLMQGERYVG